MTYSIVIPAYNCDQYIGKCLDSILLIDSHNFEVIIVNDGSNDSTKDICEEYSKKDKRIKLFNNENHGVSYSRNFGIQKSQGKWIMFVDADDELDKSWYNICNEKANLKYDFMVFYSQKDTFKNNEYLDYLFGIKKSGFYLQTPWSKLYKRDFLLKNMIEFEKQIINGEDLLFNLNCYLFSRKYKCYNVGFYKFRINMQSATKKFQKDLLFSDMLFQKEIKKLFENKNSVELNKYIEFCKTNALFTFAQRGAYTFNVRMYIDLMKNQIDNYYKKDVSVDYLSRKKRFIVNLLKRKHYTLSYLFLRIQKIRLENNSIDTIISI